MEACFLNMLKRLKLRDLANYDTIRVVDVEYEKSNVVRNLKVKLRIESDVPLHPYVLEKIRELLTALLVNSLRDVEKVLNLEVNVVEEEELENEVFSNEKEKSNTDKNEENR